MSDKVPFHKRKIPSFVGRATKKIAPIVLTGVLGVTYSNYDNANRVKSAEAKSDTYQGIATTSMKKAFEMYKILHLRALKTHPDLVRSFDEFSQDERASLKEILEKPTRSIDISNNICQAYKIGNYLSSGTCVFLSPEWVLFTNHQVRTEFSAVLDTYGYILKLPDGTTVMSINDEIEVRAISPLEDLALLHVKTKKKLKVNTLCVEDLANKKNMDVRYHRFHPVENKFVISYNATGVNIHKDFSVTVGAGLNYKSGYFKGEHPLIPGDSGMPFTNENGCVIGIMSQIGNGYDFSPRPASFLQSYLDTKENEYRATPVPDKSTQTDFVE